MAKYVLKMPGSGMTGYSVDVPYSETDYRNILAAGGSGWTIQGIMDEPVNGGAGGGGGFVAPAGQGGGVLGGLASGAASAGMQALLEWLQRHGGSGMVPAPSAVPQTSVNIPGVGYFPFFHKKHRRMNYCNVRALRRSMRRVTGFAHIAKSVMHFTKTHRLKKKGPRGRKGGRC